MRTRDHLDDDDPFRDALLDGDDGTGRRLNGGGQTPETKKTTNAQLFSAEALNNMRFEPIKYVVPGIFVEGLSLFAGKPKIGKSWLLLHAAIAVARGGFTLGDIRCQEGMFSTPRSKTTGDGYSRA